MTEGNFRQFLCIIDGMITLAFQIDSISSPTMSHLIRISKPVGSDKSVEIFPDSPADKETVEWHEWSLLHWKIEQGRVEQFQTSS